MTQRLDLTQTHLSRFTRITVSCEKCLHLYLMHSFVSISRLFSPSPVMHFDFFFFISPTLSSAWLSLQRSILTFPSTLSASSGSEREVKDFHIGGRKKIKTHTDADNGVKDRACQIAHTRYNETHWSVFFFHSLLCPSNHRVTLVCVLFTSRETCV